MIARDNRGGKDGKNQSSNVPVSFVNYFQPGFCSPSFSHPVLFSFPAVKHCLTQSSFCLLKNGMEAQVFQELVTCCTKHKTLYMIIKGFTSYLQLLSFHSLYGLEKTVYFTETGFINMKVLWGFLESQDYPVPVYLKHHLSS